MRLRRGPTCLLLLIILHVSSASAQSPDCSGPHLHVDPGVHDRWTASVAELEGRLLAGSLLDACASVALTPDPRGILATVVLRDQRTVQRVVADGKELTPTVEALLITLAPPPVAPPPPPPPAPVVQPLPEPARPAPPERGVLVEAGVGIHARLAGSPLFVGYGLVLHLDAELRGWLFGTWARWDIDDRPIRQRNLPQGFGLSSFLLGAFAGKRFELPRVSLDLLVGPNLAIEQEEADVLDPMGLAGVLGDLTLSTSLRVLTRKFGGTQLFGLLCSELYPRRVQHTVRRDPSFPALPTWSLTFAVGAAWSTR